MSEWAVDKQNKSVQEFWIMICSFPECLQQTMHVQCDQKWCEQAGLYFMQDCASFPLLSYSHPQPFPPAHFFHLLLALSFVHVIAKLETWCINRLKINNIKKKKKVEIYLDGSQFVLVVCPNITSVQETLLAIKTQWTALLK